MHFVYSFWFLLPPATKLGQGYVLQASVILLTEGEGGTSPPGLCTPQTTYPPGLHTPLDYIPPGLRTPPPWHYVLPGTTYPPGLCTPRTTYPPRGRSMCGRYASYWNAFLSLQTNQKPEACCLKSKPTGCARFADFCANSCAP